MIRLVLFDIDGTLIQSGGAGERAFGEVARTLFDLPQATQGLRFAGRTDPTIVREMFRRHGVPETEENFEKFFGAYVFWLDHLIPQISGRVLPGVQAWIAGLRELPHAPAIGLLTGNIRLGAEIKLRHYGLWDAFMVGGFSDDREDRCEIAAVARERACRLLGRKLDGGEILVVGDTPLDIECGRSISARVVAVGTGVHQHEELLRYKPDWCVPSLSNLDPKKICV